MTHETPPQNSLMATQHGSAETDGPSGQQWLTLGEASDFLGVHFTTLRSWADKGEIRVFRTPGGHRRFSLEDLRRFLEQRAGYAVTTSVTGLVDAAVGRARAEIDRGAHAERRWHYALDEEANAVRRQRGRELFALAISFVLKPRRRPKLLDEGRRLGAEYGCEAARNGVGLVETGRAVQFFRHQLVQAVQHGESADAPDADDVRIQRLVHEFLDEVLYAVLDGYERTLLEMHGRGG